MYRVDSWDSLESTGFFDYMESDCILVVEWSENIEGALPELAYRVSLEPGSTDDERIIKISGGRS